MTRSEGAGHGGTAIGNDLRLVHEALPTWMHGARQALLGSNYISVDPTTKIVETPVQVDFDLPNKEPLLFGPMSKFRIKGSFQKFPDGGTAWANVPAEDVANVLLQPNWFEHLVKECSIFSSNNRVSNSSELRYISPYVNSYLAHNMDPIAKKILFPQKCHPGYCNPKPGGNWSLASEAWKDYAKSVFTGEAIEFDYIPLFVFPFYQNANWMIDGEVPRIVPTPAMGRMQIRFTFTDSQSHIFRKPAVNKAKYRFCFTEFYLVLEEARLSQAYSNSLKNSKRLLGFPGVTRIQLVEPIPDSSSTYRTRFQSIFLPEALFIFCLNKSVSNGTYKFSAVDTNYVFTPHNISSVDLSFDGKRFSLKEPFIGNILNDELDSKQLFDHLANPPFGIRQDPAGLTYDNVNEGCKNTPYSHVYLSLVTGPDGQRLIPALDDGSCIRQKSDLELDIKFTKDNSQSNAIYVIMAIYTDVNVVFDVKNQRFTSPYLQYIN